MWWFLMGYTAYKSTIENNAKTFKDAKAVKTDGEIFETHWCVSLRYTKLNAL